MILRDTDHCSGDTRAPTKSQTRPSKDSNSADRTGFTSAGTSVLVAAAADCFRPPPRAGMRFWHADALFTLHSSLKAGQHYYADVKGRAASAGRNPDQLKVFPAATFVTGDTAEEAADYARRIRHQPVSGATAMAMLEQVWDRELSDYDSDGPLPDIDPIGNTSITQGRVRHGDPAAVVRRYRERAEAENLLIRELVSPSAAGSNSSAPPHTSPKRSTDICKRTS